jgi:UDP-N-acetyl-D-mannosaminuronic acid transferase (WecB/TagA/CpsF family)
LCRNALLRRWYCTGDCVGVEHAAEFFYIPPCPHRLGGFSFSSPFCRRQQTLTVFCPLSSVLCPPSSVLRPPSSVF